VQRIAIVMAVVSQISKTFGSWGTCPNCSANLKRQRIEAKFPYECPFCETSLDHALWQRVLAFITGVTLSFVFPAFLGARGVTLLFAAFVCYVPALLIAYPWLLTIVSPKYIRKEGDSKLMLFPK
jgi:hypothetical protein